MSDDDALARKLATLTAKDAFDGKALRLGASGQTDSLAHILQAIDDTMLLRHVVFAVGTSSVTLRISGKRLQSVVAASADLAAPAALIGQPFSVSSQAELTMIAELLRRLVERPGTLTVERQEADETVGQSGSGVGVQSLVASWESKTSDDADDPIEMFLGAWLALAVAYVEIEGDTVVEADGADETIAELMALDESTWARFRDAHSQIHPQDTGPQLFVLQGLTSGDSMLVAAVFDDRQFLAAVAQNAITQVTSAWAAAI